MAPKGGGGGGETCCIHRNEEKRVCSKRFPRQGRLSRTFHNCKAQAADKQKWIRFLFHRLSSKRRKTPFKAGKGGRDLNEVFTLFFSLALGAISYSEWPFSAITPVHPRIRPSSSFHYRCCPNRKWRRRRPDSLPRLLT